MSNVIPTISIILPAYNEQVNLPLAIDALMAQMRCSNITAYEIIVVDDGSSDNTWTVLKQLDIKSSPDESVQLQGLRLSRNFGKEAAIFAGLEATRGRAVIVIDCDLQHPPALISEMIQLWQQHIDIVDAVKSHRGNETWIKCLCSKLFYSSFKMLSGYDLRGSSDYKLLDRAVVDSLMAMGERNLFFRGMVGWLGYSRHQLTFEVQKRLAGTSGWPVKRLIKMAIEATTSYSFIPLRLVAVAGFIFLVLAAIMFCYTLVYKLLGLAVSGFSTVIILQLFTGSLCMLSIGIIGEYVARIYEEVKGRPRYIVAQRILSGEKNKAEY
jgi:glycosyltransferase involved in cell wall biosynthesis